MIGLLQGPIDSIISIGDVSIQNNPKVIGAKHKRHKSTLPSIKGVNRNSLGLLIDHPETLFADLATHTKRGFSTRNNSVMNTMLRFNEGFD